MTTTRRGYKGAAVITTLSAPIGTGDTTINITAASGWPDGTGGPSEAVIDRGQSTEESIMFTGRSSTSLTGVSRGQNDTVAVSHAAGASIEHVATKRDIDEANAHAAGTEADPHGTGVNALLNNTRHDTTSRHTAGTVVPAGSTASASNPGDVGAGGAAASFSRSDHVHAREAAASSFTFPAMTSFTPSTSGLTIGNGTINAKYNTVGKRTWLSIVIRFGSTTSLSGTLIIGYPTGVTPTSLGSDHQLLEARVLSSANMPAFAEAQAGGILVYCSTTGATSQNTVSNTHPTGMTTSSIIQVHGSVEIA